MILLSIYSIALSRNFNETEKEISYLKECLWKYSSVDRIHNKDERLLTLSSIDEDFFKKMYDVGFDDPKNLLNTVKTLELKCETEKKLRICLN